MKRLCLIRHAKSSWHHLTLDDLQRPLDSSGVEDGRWMSRFLHDKGIKPDVILTSPAVRALETAKLLAEGLEYPLEAIRVEEAIYDATVEDLVAVIGTLPPEYTCVLLVGHNPGLTWLANYLAEDHLINLPTSGAYCVEFVSESWEDITEVDGKTLFTANPKMKQA